MALSHSGHCELIAHLLPKQVRALLTFFLLQRPHLNDHVWKDTFEGEIGLIHNFVGIISGKLEQKITLSVPFILSVLLNTFFITIKYTCSLFGLPRWYSGEESACPCRRHRRHQFHSWARKIPWSSKGHLLQYSSPGKSQGQRRLAGCCPWGCRVRHNWAGTHAPCLFS